MTCDTSVNKRAVTVATAPRQVNTNSVHELTSTASGSGRVQTLKEQNAGRVRSGSVTTLSDSVGV